jgi:hypothetical protein
MSMDTVVFTSLVIAQIGTLYSLFTVNCKILSLKKEIEGLLYKTDDQEILLEILKKENLELEDENADLRVYYRLYQAIEGDRSFR